MYKFAKNINVENTHMMEEIQNILYIVCRKISGTVERKIIFFSAN